MSIGNLDRAAELVRGATRAGLESAWFVRLTDQTLVLRDLDTDWWLAAPNAWSRRIGWPHRSRSPSADDTREALTDPLQADEMMRAKVESY